MINSADSNLDNYEATATKTMMLVLGLYLLQWTPLSAAIVIVRVFGLDRSLIWMPSKSHMGLWFFVAFTISACSNPVIFAARMKPVGDALRKVFIWIYCCCGFCCCYCCYCCSICFYKNTRNHSKAVKDVEVATEQMSQI